VAAKIGQIAKTRRQWHPDPMRTVPSVQPGSHLRRPTSWSSWQTWMINRFGGLRLTNRVAFCGLGLCAR
jgi:hypothetical protein